MPNQTKPKYPELHTAYDLEINLLTSVHVGAGNDKLWLKNIDYFLQNRQVMVVDQNALFQLLLNTPGKGHESALDEYSQLLAGNKIDGISDFLIEKEIDMVAVAKHQLSYPENEPATEIRSLIRTGTGIPYLPGSSIKGALRSVIFNYLYQTSPSRNFKGIDDQILGRFEKSVMRFIRPFDVQIPNSKVVNIDLLNLYSEGDDWESDYKDSFSISAEVYESDTALPFRLSISEGFIALLNEQGIRDNAYFFAGSVPKILPRDQPIDHLFNIVNEYTRRHLDKEIEFLSKYDQAEDVDKVVTNLRELRQKTEDNTTSCILRMAYGSGFHGITGDWRFDNHLDTINRPDSMNKVYSQTERRKVNARYKSRRFTGMDVETNLMGFLEIGKKTA